MASNELLITLSVFVASYAALVAKLLSENDGKGSFSTITHFLMVTTFISSFFILVILLLTRTFQVSHAIALVTIVSVFVVFFRSFARCNYLSMCMRWTTVVRIPSHPMNTIPQMK